MEADRRRNFGRSEHSNWVAEGQGWAGGKENRTEWGRGRTRIWKGEQKAIVPSALVAAGVSLGSPACCLGRTRSGLQHQDVFISCPVSSPRSRQTSECGLFRLPPSRYPRHLTLPSPALRWQRRGGRELWEGWREVSTRRSGSGPHSLSRPSPVSSAVLPGQRTRRICPPPLLVFPLVSCVCGI